MFEKCSCQHCGGHIEFDASHVGQVITCPHCALDMTLVVPAPLKRNFFKKAKSTLKQNWVKITVGFLLIFAGCFSYWNSASWETSSTVRKGDVQIDLNTKSDFHFWPFNRSRTASYKDGFFIIRLTNLSDKKIINFSPWLENFSLLSGVATLTDNNGNSYKRVHRDLREYGQNDEEESIYPKKTAVYFLSFEPPTPNCKWLHLELPARNFGGFGKIRFEIQNDDIH